MKTNHLSLDQFVMFKLKCWCFFFFLEILKTLKSKHSTGIKPKHIRICKLLATQTCDCFYKGFLKPWRKKNIDKATECCSTGAYLVAGGGKAASTGLRWSWHGSSSLYAFPRLPWLWTEKHFNGIQSSTNKETVSKQDSVPPRPPPPPPARKGNIAPTSEILKESISF